MLTESEEEAEEASAVSAMWRETLLQGGGRRLQKTGGGILYEAASRREKKCWTQAAQQPSDYGLLTGGVCHLPKCSVEGERTKESLARKDFVCDGTLYRHTKLSWGEVPVQYREAHGVKVSERQPAKTFVHQHLIEDLTPFERHLYWETIWRKCATCHRNDCRFGAWAAWRKLLPSIQTKVDVARLGPKQRCLRHLRDRLGGEVFVLVGSYVPMACLQDLRESERSSIASALRRSAQDKHDHWLAPHVDRPRHVRVKVSAHALAEAISPRVRRGTRLDADAIYALLAMRHFDTSWAPAEDEIEDTDVDIEQTDSERGSYDDMLPDTPLCSALGVGDAAIVRLLLENRADPNGYQSREFDWEDGEPYTEISPLHSAVMHRRPDLVSLLLQARADADAYGYWKHLSGEAVHPDGGQHSDQATPLWYAVEDACDCSPSSSQGREGRDIVRLLLLYGARPDKIGKIEYFTSASGKYDAELDGPVDSDGNMHTSDSETSPLEAARKWTSTSPDLTSPEDVYQRWSADVLEMLRSLAP